MDARLKRFALQAVAGELLPEERVAWCLRRLGFQKKGVEVWVAEKVHRAHLKGVIVCGSVWTCPVCAAKITERRRVEMSEALEKSRGKFTPVLVTLTLQHDRNDQLADLVKSLADSWRAFRSGKAWQGIAANYGLAASVTGMEATWGRVSGWHPHKHALFFSSLPKDRIDVDELQAVLSARWQSVLARLSEYAHIQFGVKVSIGDDKAGDYVGKWGLEFELAKSPVKNGREGGFSPFQLLELHGQGKAWAGALFQEYAVVMKGRKQLTWSRGARELLGIAKIEQSDQELAEAAEEQSYLFAALTWQQFKLIIQASCKGRQAVIGELLEVASYADPDLFWGWLEQFGILANDSQRVQSAYPWLLPQNNGLDVHAMSRQLERVRAERLELYRAKMRKWRQLTWNDPPPRSDLL